MAPTRIEARPLRFTRPPVGLLKTEDAGSVDDDPLQLAADAWKIAVVISAEARLFTWPASPGEPVASAEPSAP